jgi:dihydroorotase-like cyclic amidohydrolase
MSSILIKNANLISVSANRNKIERNVDILIKGGKISKIGIELNDSTDQVIKANNR